MSACPAKLLKCGEKNIVLDKAGEEYTFKAVDLTIADQCAWSITAKCGAISFKMGSKSTITKDYASISVVEYSKALSTLGGYNYHSDATHQSNNKLASSTETVWLDDQTIYLANELGRRKEVVAPASGSGHPLSRDRLVPGNSIYEMITVK